MSDSIQAVQISDQSVALSWTVDTPPVELVVERTTNPPDTPKEILRVPGAPTGSGLDSEIAALTIGDVLEYALVDPAGPTTLATAAQISVADLDEPYTYGPVNPLHTAPRYTTLAAVKTRLGVTTADKDDALTQAIVAAEYALDAHLGRSFPDSGTNPQWIGIPIAVVQAAENASVATYKAADAPFGVAGSDDFLGTIDAFEVVRREVRRSPVLMGLRVAWGVA